MIKLTVLYGHPTDASAFEEYYAGTHVPLALQMKGHDRVELTKFMNGPDGAQAAYYRMAEFWFVSAEAMQATMASAEGQVTAADLANFATGGVTFMMGEVAE